MYVYNNANLCTFVLFIIDLQYNILDVVEPADAASAPAEENTNIVTRSPEVRIMPKVRYVLLVCHIRM